MNGRADPVRHGEPAKWCELDMAALRRIFEAATAGKQDAASWPQLAAYTTASAGDDAQRDMTRRAYIEALSQGALFQLATEVMAVLAERSPATADASALPVDLKPEQCGSMQAIVQAGGIKNSATLLGAVALNAATAVVYRGSRVIGTAFLVARDLVVTAAHVVCRHDGAQFEQSLADDLSFSFRVVESRVRSESVIAYPAPSRALVACSLPWGRPPNRLAITPDDEARDRLDFALIRLDRSITHVEPVDIRHPPTPKLLEPLLVLGFPGGTAMGWDTGVIDSVDRYRLKHKVNTLPGMSGSCCIDIEGRPIAIHEGSLADNTYSFAGHQGPLGVNRAVCLRDIRDAMLARGRDPLANASETPAIAIYSDLLVGRWARSGLRLAPAQLHDEWRRYVQEATGAAPDDGTAFPPFYPWFRRTPFEQWFDRADRPAERLCIVSGPPGAGKSFLAEILRAKVRNPAQDVVLISATETTAWSWRDAMQKWGIEPDPQPMRPQAGLARHDDVPLAAARVASFGGRANDAPDRPLYVAIDFDGSASFPAGEDAPWLPFMADLLGYPWVRLVVLGAPDSITQDLLDGSDEGELVATEIALQPLNERDYRLFAKHLLRTGSTGEADLPALLEQVMPLHQRTVEVFHEPQLLTAATVLAALMLKKSFQG